MSNKKRGPLKARLQRRMSDIYPIVKGKGLTKCTRCGRPFSSNEAMYCIAKPVGDELLPEPANFEEAVKRGHLIEEVCPTCWAKQPEPAKVERL